MMQDSYNTDRDLRGCGLTPESIQAIKATTVITRDGAQHVVPTSQAHLNEAPSQIESGLTQQIQDVSRMLSRHKQFSDQRIAQLEKNVQQLMDVVKEQQATILTLRSNHVAQQKQQSLAQTYADEATEETTREIKSRPAADVPIDRNRVKPSDVKVEDIFYSGTRR